MRLRQKGSETLKKTLPTRETLKKGKNEKAEERGRAKRCRNINSPMQI